VSLEDRVEGRAGARGLRLPAWLDRKALLLFVAVLVVLYAAPLLRPLGDYTHSVVGLTFMFMSAALAWNWLGGYVGQISFGHAAMFGVGGFVAARLALTLGLPFWVTWLVGGLAAGAYGLLWGHPTLRLRGPYFSIATIGVGEATRLVATYWDRFTGGSSGLSLPISQGPTKYALYWYGLYLLAGVVALSYWLRRSRIGLGLLAIKEDVEAAAGVGVNATLYQDLVLFASGAVVGVCGAFYASYRRSSTRWACSASNAPSASCSWAPSAASGPSSGRSSGPSCSSSSRSSCSPPTRSSTSGCTASSSSWSSCSSRSASPGCCCGSRAGWGTGPPPVWPPAAWSPRRPRRRPKPSPAEARDDPAAGR